MTARRRRPRAGGPALPLETRRLLATLRAIVDGGRLDRPSEDERGCVRDPRGRVALYVASPTLSELDRRGYLEVGGDGIETASAEGRAFMARVLGGPHGHLAQHKVLARRVIETDDGERVAVTVDAAESPLAWLAARRDAAGRPYLDAAQVAAGEKLRIDARRAALPPRITSRWDGVPSSGTGQGPAAFIEGALAARDRVNDALAAVGPELSGVLLDVCCFLKGLEAVEAERGWPPRSARIVLQLALTRLAAHYGIASHARGPRRGRVRAWRGDPRDGAEAG